MTGMSLGTNSVGLRAPTSRASTRPPRVTVCGVHPANQTAERRANGTALGDTRRPRGKSSLLLFLDSADKREWDTYFPTGVFYGITTNPTILKRDGVPCEIESLRQLAEDAFGCGAQELLMQAWGSTAEEMAEIGYELASIDPRINIKCPLTKTGIEAAQMLQQQHVDLTLTACYATHQALTASSLGASYLAPYLGRMNDNGRDGMQNIINMHKIMRATSASTRVMVASIRSADDMALLAAEGLDVFTFSPAVAQQLFTDPLTEAAAAQFEADASLG
eukprot:CAMPEP_0118952172 /NCGR_PEP_ID=MMETSP1169-20130426/54421_1 /TAXON_ID=36882 /ORGANISM="Pyramimonas obovata, Strain CCMP722" /LENGTH=276 /DNA_ID=CAMNT_0006899363 /DNA_START=31 /DNA_END=861 /DNA_ORIENTATION=+